jgi:hypothetical protein
MPPAVHKHVGELRELNRSLPPVLACGIPRDPVLRTHRRSRAARNRRQADKDQENDQEYHLFHSVFSFANLHAMMIFLKLGLQISRSELYQ